jgi:hypothetical protein
MDSLAAYRLKVAWSSALTALAVANACPKYTFSFRIARLQAQKAIDLYFEEVERASTGYEGTCLLAKQTPT